MRHRLVVLAAVLAVAGPAGCGRDRNARPAPQAQAPVSGRSAGASPGAASAGLPGSGPAPGASAGVPGGSAGPRVDPENPIDPAGGAKGRPQSLPTGNEISATGIGPYTIGQQQAALGTAKLVGPVTSGPDGCDTGTGRTGWGSPVLIFTKGRLQHVKISTGSVRTTAGVKVGFPYARVRAAYPKGSPLSARGATAWYAPTGDFALLFRLTGGRVAAIESGPASTLPFTFTSNQGC